MDSISRIRFCPKESVPPKPEKNIWTTNHEKSAAINSYLNQQYSSYKYTVYRCASKVLTLQKILSTKHIPFRIVLQILGNHNLMQADDSLPVRPPQLSKIIEEIFITHERIRELPECFSYNVKLTTEILTDFLMDVFDPINRSQITLLEFKEAFLFLCKVNSLEQLMSAYFLLVADHNRCISKFRFTCLMKILTKLLTYLDEDAAYGEKYIPEIIEQTYANSPGINGITEYQFHCLWTSRQTRFLVYANLIALIKRMKECRSLLHNVGCSACRSECIVGIRFKCQSCKNLSLCLKCFASGHTSDRHAVGHRMYEIFADDVPDVKWSHYISKLCNIFQNTNLKTGDPNKNINGGDENGAACSLDNNNTTTEKVRMSPNLNTDSFDTVAAATIRQQLQFILEKLVAENKKVFIQKNMLSDTTQYDFFQEHEDALGNIVQRIRALMGDNASYRSYPSCSTPHRLNLRRSPRLNDVSRLSRSINGADINKSYLEANKSDFSMGDLSIWFHQRHHNVTIPKKKNLPIVTEHQDTEDKAAGGGGDAAAGICGGGDAAAGGCGGGDAAAGGCGGGAARIGDSDMNHFRELLNKVKEIVEDSYSDNNELQQATQNLEDVLDNIIRDEENSRQQNPTAD